MTANLYKKLFEVQLLHEYYLTDSDGSSVFDDITKAGDFLTTRQQQGRPSVTRLVQFVLAGQTQQVFRDQQLILMNTYSGFQVVAKVTASVVGGKSGFTPAAALADGCNLIFLVRQPEGGLGAITNGRMKREINSLYYFCNSGVTGTKIFPFLTNPVPAKQDPTVYAYQQGELVNDGGAMEFAYYNNNGTVGFGSAGATSGLVNENDRMLVGLVFNYTFAATDSVTSASFVLKDASGTMVKTINQTANTALGTVSLDFSVDAQGAALPINALPDAGLSDPIVYTLTVTGSGTAAAGSTQTAYSKVFTLVFYTDTTELAGCWAVIQVQAKVDGASYSLTDANQQLTQPVFQICCKSLPTFRRYANNSGQPIALASDSPLVNIVQQTGDTVTTLEPVPLTYMPYFFAPNQFEGETGTTSGTAPPAAGGGAGAATAQKPKGTVFLPAPDPGGSMDFENNQLTSVVLVPVTDLFPLPDATNSNNT